jgi:hypothetical protein
MTELRAAVKQLLLSCCPEGAAFFRRADAEAPQPLGVSMRALFASVPRRLGASAAAAPPEPLGGAGLHWTATDYARLWLLLGVLPQIEVESQPDWLLQLFEAGEMGEQVSVLRVLPLLPDAGRFVETGVQACRTNARDVFEAIVCENPFLVEHFPELSFNQAIMKAIFMEVPLSRVQGLERRITPELSRMAAGYASERRAAGRPVPKDAEFLAHYGAR